MSPRAKAKSKIENRSSVEKGKGHRLRRGHFLAKMNLEFSNTKGYDLPNLEGS